MNKESSRSDKVIIAKRMESSGNKPLQSFPETSPAFESETSLFFYLLSGEGT
jgi:hypothetical protein